MANKKQSSTSASAPITGVRFHAEQAQQIEQQRQRLSTVLGRPATASDAIRYLVQLGIEAANQEQQ